MAKHARSPSKRFLKLAGMTASIATKSVANSIRNLNADEEQKNAARSQLFQDIGLQIADTLGEMKGAVVKSPHSTKIFSHLKSLKQLPNYNAKRQQCLSLQLNSKLKKS